MGLVHYESSDEDEDVQVEETAPPQVSSSKPAASQSADAQKAQPPTVPRPSQQPPSWPQSSAGTDEQPTSHTTAEEPSVGPVLGPALGPTLPPPTNTQPDEPDPLAFLDTPATPSPPRSPYTATRTILHDLTLPAVPSLSIPPSPTNHPDITPLTTKFTTFLTLKRRSPNPQHFNARLAGSDALKNPALMDKLMGFVGIETEVDERDGTGVEQYETVLGKEVWDPRGFPAWAYKGELRRTGEEEKGRRSRGRGERVDFVKEGGAGAAPVREGRRTMFDT